MCSWINKINKNLCCIIQVFAVYYIYKNLSLRLSGCFGIVKRCHVSRSFNLGGFMSGILNKLILSGRTGLVPGSSQLAGMSPLDYSQINNNLPSLNALCGTTNLQTHLLNPQYSAFIKLLFLYALRFIELYSAKLSDIIYPDRIQLNGAKLSSGTIIFVPLLSESFIITQTNLNNKIFPNISYKKCYLLIKRINIPTIKMNSCNTAATHFGRKYIDVITKGCLSNTQLSDVLRHRSKTSCVYYRSK
jgi:hypothetical protein